MIRINDFIYNENEIQHIMQDDKELHIVFKNGDDIYVEATFEDIEWNYEQRNTKEDEYIELSNKYQRLSNRNEELEEENKKLKKELEIEINSSNVKSAQNKDKEIKIEQLETRIDKAVEYINGNCYLLRSRNYIDLDKNDVIELLKILKGEENESN